MTCVSSMAFASEFVDIEPMFENISQAIVDTEIELRVHGIPRDALISMSPNTAVISLEDAWALGASARLKRLRDKVRVSFEDSEAQPSSKCYLVANRILTALVDASLKPDSIDVSTDGGVCFSFRNGLRYADIECFDESEVLAVTSEGGDNTKVWDVGSSDFNIASAIGEIRAFAYR